MLVTFKLHNPNDRDLAGFIRTLTDNHYTISFDKKGTTHLMARVEISDAQIRESAPETVCDDTEEVLENAESTFESDMIHDQRD